MTRRAVIALVLVLSGPAHAQDQGVYAAVFDCGRWIEGRTAGYDQGVWYLRGLIDGLALGTATEIWHAGGVEMTVAQAALWMDKYCRENPLSHVIAGTYQLRRERLAGR